MLLFILLLSFVGLTIGLVWYLLTHDHGHHEPIGALWIAAALGCLAAIVAGLLEGLILGDHLTLLGRGSLAPLVWVAAVVGVLEEGFKFIPLALFLYPKRYFSEHTDGVIYFAIAGLAFGLPENILYTLQYGTKAGLMRVVLTPFFHAATTALVGYYLAKVKVDGLSKGMVVVALGVAIVLHGLYDFGLMSGVELFTVVSFMITLGTTTGLFLFFMRANELDKAMLEPGVGEHFCTVCGRANTNSRNLYCVYCGAMLKYPVANQLTKG